MSKNEQRRESNPVPFLDFIQTFDGTQPEVDSRERELVSERFNALVADTFLSNIHEVKNRDLPLKDSLLLHKEESGSSIGWSLSIEKRTDNRVPSDDWESAEEIKADISIQKLQGVFGRDMTSYRLGSDGVVRRHDLGDIYGKMQAEKELGIGRTAMFGSEASPEDLISHAEDMMVQIREFDIPNSRLERSMGLNGQPISIVEMEGLEAFVRQPGFTPKII